jgi:hypothetical protein
VAESGEPKLKRFYVAAMLDAAREIWGEDGVHDVARRMPEREREEILAPQLPPWVPERVLIAWNFALWEGPANRSRQAYVPWLKRTTDLSFGIVKRLFLSLASPERFFADAHGLWKADHTHGTLEGRIDGKRGVLVLRDHPYTETPQARAALAEMLRYIVELTRAKDVTETHGLSPKGTLEVKLAWR